MLNTIRVPKKLHYLTERLPESNYRIKNKKASFSVSKDSANSNLPNNYSINKMNHDGFPKLDRILKYHEELISDKKNR